MSQFVDNVALISWGKQSNTSKYFYATVEIVRNCSSPRKISECKIRKGYKISANFYDVLVITLTITRSTCRYYFLITDTRVAGKRANQLQERYMCTSTSDCEGLCLYFEIPICHIQICVCIRNSK